MTKRIGGVKMPVVVRCTVYCGGEVAFVVEGDDMFHVAADALQEVRDSQIRLVYSEKELQWKFERIYPERAEATFAAPPTDKLLESWSEYVAKQ